MALGNVFMTDTDGNIGGAIPATPDKVCGLLFDISKHADFWTKGQGLVAAANFKDAVVELNSLDDAEKLGIIPFTTDKIDGDAGAKIDGNLLAGIPYYHIKHFFSVAGGTGRLFVAFADCSRDWNALIDMQKAANGMISQFGVWTEQCIWKNTDVNAPLYAVDLVKDINSVAVQMANDYFAPASIILSPNTSKVQGTNSTSNTVQFSKIGDAVVDARYVSVLLSQAMDVEVGKMQASLESTTPVGVIGLALGMLTQVNVGQSIGWVQRCDLGGYVPGIEMGFGDSTIKDEALTSATDYSALTKFQLDELDNKGYIFLRTFAGLEGHAYFSKDQTCSNGDYCTIARNRAINKTRRLIRQALLPYVNSPVKVDPANGNISAAQATIYRNLIKTALDSMETAEEISGSAEPVVPVAQNILVTHKLTFKYSVIPLGCADSIEITEGLAVSR